MDSSPALLILAMAYVISIAILCFMLVSPFSKPSCALIVKESLARQDPYALLGAIVALDVGDVLCLGDEQGRPVSKFQALVNNPR